MKQLEWADYATTLGLGFLSGANVSVYPQSDELRVAGRSVRCTRTQLRYLVALLRNFCRTVPHEELAGSGRKVTPRQQNTMKVQMFYLRRLLASHGAQLEIRTVHGTGYQARPIAR
jgi:DNA-binding response OmpR family regulator